MGYKLIMIVKCYQRGVSRLLYSFATGRKTSLLRGLDTQEISNYQERIKFPEKYRKLGDLETVLKLNMRDIETSKPKVEQKIDEAQELATKKRNTNIVFAILLFIMFKDVFSLETSKNANKAFKLEDLDEIEAVEMRTLYGVTSEGQEATKY